jgi:carnitine-CoA ligase
MLKGYHNDPQATVESVRDLWWHTGDLASCDADGFFYYFDRKKDSLRRRGENISSKELEAAIAVFPDIGEVAIVGIDGDYDDIELFAVFETMDPDAFSYRSLFDHCVRTVPRYMIPRYYRAVQTLPRTPTGKVRKIELRQGGLTEGVWDYVALNLSVPRQ